MNCPQCGSNNLYVIDSRRDDGKTIRRRRKCADCGYRFNSVELAMEQLTEVQLDEKQIYLFTLK